MSKQPKTPRIVDTPPEAVAPAAAAEAGAAAPPADPAGAAAEPPAPVARASVAQRLLEAAKARLRGTRLERLAKRAAATAAKAPALAERELDLALDRLGLVRKSKAQPAGSAGAPAPKAA